MASNLTWIDHDAAARERSLRVLDLFREQDSRDELGLGGIRDSIADHLFPGTSTIQTRLRYMLFIPWVYQRLEHEHVPASEFGARARQRELDLIAPLKASDDTRGVVGGGVGRGLKRLPSDAYWAGLGTWGIRRIDASKDEYHRVIDRIRALRGPRSGHADDEGGMPSAAVTWHPQLPAPPADFPKTLGFALTRAEAEFVRDAIATTCPGSLIAWLAREERPGAAPAAWAHPDLARFPGHIRLLLEHARLFSVLMQGAAILYNLAVADLDGRDALVDEHRSRLAEWSAGLPMPDLVGWNLDDFWTVVASPRHGVTPAARRFVAAWLDLVRAGAGSLSDDPMARRLVEQRERTLKKARSRFANAGARKQWGGRSGLKALSYRWETARTFLDDLHHGLQAR